MDWQDRTVFKASLIAAVILFTLISSGVIV